MTEPIDEFKEHQLFLAGYVEVDDMHAVPVYLKDPANKLLLRKIGGYTAEELKTIRQTRREESKGI